MAQKITWQEPSEDTVTKVYIYRSATLYGTYSQIAVIDATSDGNPKSSSNTWVTTYTDVNGQRTDWYKIRFYDGTNFSEYSDPTTSEELVRLCTVDDIKKAINTVGRWTDDEIFDAITKEDDLIYIEMGVPIQAVYSEIGKIDETVQRRYYVGEENIYRVDRVFYGTTSKVELFLDDGYRVNTRYGMVEILPYASSGIDPSTDCEIEIHYVPKVFNKLCIWRTVVRLLEQLDTVSGGSVSKELEVAKERLKNVETLISNRFCLQVSSALQGYDKYYGVNRKHIVQDFYRNRYIGSQNW